MFEHADNTVYFRTWRRGHCHYKRKRQPIKRLPFSFLFALQFIDRPPQKIGFRHSRRRECGGYSLVFVRFEIDRKLLVFVLDLLGVPFVRRLLCLTPRHGCTSLYCVARGDKFLQRVKGRTIRLCDVERHADVAEGRCKRPTRRGFVDGVNRPVFLDSHIVPP